MQYLNICHDSDPACQASLVSLCDRTMSEDVKAPVDSISHVTSSYQILCQLGAGPQPRFYKNRHRRVGVSRVQNLSVWANEVRSLPIFLGVPWLEGSLSIWGGPDVSPLVHFIYPGYTIIWLC